MNKAEAKRYVEENITIMSMIKLIKLFSFNYKGMILLLPSQRTIEGRQVLSSVEVTGHRHSAVTVP